MMEYIEVNGQEVEKYEYILSKEDKENGEQEPRVKIDIDNELLRSGKTKALIIIMPHYDNDKPTVINVGLEQSEVGQAIDIAEGTFHDDTYKKDIARLEQEVYRLEKKLEKAEEESIYGTENI
jgi:hypothetical protein